MNPTRPTATSQVSHNGYFGEYPLPRLICQRLTADHHCRDPPFPFHYGRLIKRLPSHPVGCRAGVVRTRHEHVVCGRATRAFGIYVGVWGETGRSQAWVELGNEVRSGGVRCTA